MTVRPPSTGTGSVTVDYFSAILHALLPNLNMVELPPSIGANSTQIDYLHAIWKATQANGTLNIPPYDNDTAAIAGGLVAGNLYQKPDGSVWVVKSVSSRYGYYGDGGFDGIGSGFLYPSLESLQAEIDLLISKVSTSQSYSNNLFVPGGSAVESEVFTLPPYTSISSIILFPTQHSLDRITVKAYELYSSYNEVILDLFNVAPGGDKDNPYLVNKVYYNPVKIRVYRESFSNGNESLLFFKAILQ